MKRYISIFLTAVILLVTMCIPYGINAQYSEFTVKPFADTTNGSWYEESAVYCFIHGYIKGTSEGYFSPDQNLTRAMAVQILGGMCGITDSYYSEAFTDVPSDAWFRNAVYWAYDNGITKGTGNQYFSPDQKITRQDFVTMIHGYNLKYSHGEHASSPSSSLSVFRDSQSISNYATEAMAWAAENGLINGYTDNTIRPGATITRAEVAKIIRSYDSIFGHKWLGYALSQRTCTTNGTSVFTCSKCNDQRLVTTSAYHIWNNGVVTQFPTCITNGTKTFTCTACYSYYTEAIPKTGVHVYSDWITTTEATLYRTGTQTRKCMYCTDSFTRIYRSPSYYQIQDKITLPSGGYNLSTANIGLKVIYTNNYFFGNTNASYTSSTANAVRRFQKSWGLPQTGIVDLATWKAMGYSEYSWYNMGTYVTPLKVNAYSTREEHIEAMLTTAWEYADASTVYRIGCSGEPGTYADCSGLIYQCLYSAGINPDTNIVDHALAVYEYTSRYLAADSKLGLSVSYSEMERGDLVFYANRGTSTVIHVGIYAGNGMMYDAWPGIGTTYRSVHIPGCTIVKIIRVFP